MATDVANDLEGGSNTTAISTSNAGGTGNTQLNVVSVTGSSPAPTFDNTHSRGSLAAKITTGATGQTRIGWNATALSAVSEGWLRFYAYFTANPGVALHLAAITHAATGDGAALRLNTTGHLYVEDNAGGIQATMSAAVTLNAWVRVEFHAILNATNGTMDAWLYNTADAAIGSPTETIQSTVGPTGTSGNTYDAWYFGAPFQILSIQGPWWIDDLAASTSAQLGPSSVTPTTSAVAAAAGLDVSYVSAFTPGTPSPGIRRIIGQAAQRAASW